MKHILRTALLAALCLSACSTSSEEVTMVGQFPTDITNSNYPSAKAPLQPQALIKLPVGSIQPGGWLRAQLLAQKNGLNGHLGEISAWLQKEDNAWLTEGGSWGWEEVPYWLRGYASLSYVFREESMLAETQSWIEAILASQLPNGNFGPSARTENQDFWPNMIALWILQDYCEYTGDERVIPFMTRYCEYLLTVPDDKFLEDYWEESRGGDNLWSVVWLYSRTGDERLLELAHKLHRNTAEWFSYDFPNYHNVNIAQGFREPAEYYLFTGDKKMLEATYDTFRHVRQAFGQVPGGMFCADENARLGFIDPRQGAETCGFVEHMASDEILLLIDGGQLWAENCEDLAFNTFPAALTPDMKSLRYITSPNMTVSDSENHHPGIDNRGPFLCMNPFSSRCCQHNHGFGWPYYSQYLVMATHDNGLAVQLYGECSAQALVADGVNVVIDEKTRYPFEEKVEFIVSPEKSTSFPLYLRIPRWCSGARIKVNGVTASCRLDAGGFARIERVWNEGDKVALELPMSLSKRTWQANSNSVSVDYGPLTLSLKIEENYTKVDSRESAIGDSKWQNGADASQWPTWLIKPSSDWNYALATDADIMIHRGSWPDNDNPFTTEGCPISFSAKGRIVPSWAIDCYGLTGVLPDENAPKSDRLDDITLIPMGAARLRISAFPTCSAR